MFGINKALTKWLIIVVMGIVAICAVVTGCTPNDGTEFTQRQLALATKTNVDSSKKDESQDNSITLNLGDSQEPENQTISEVITKSFVGQSPAKGTSCKNAANSKIDKIYLALEKVLLTQSSQAEELATVVEARANEREKVILAEASGREKEIRAHEEKWRLLVWGGRYWCSCSC